MELRGPVSIILLGRTLLPVLLVVDAINANRSFGMVTAISADHIFGMDISANPIWLSFASIILLLLSIPNFRLVYQVRF